MQSERVLDERYDRFFQDFPVGLFVSTPGGEVVRVNAVLVEMLGHALMTLTLDAYSHVLPNMQHEAAPRTEAMLMEDKDETAHG